MKIYKKVVMDFDGKVLEEDSYEYLGDVALCKGGSSVSYTESPAQQENLSIQNQLLREQAAENARMRDVYLARSGLKFDASQNKYIPMTEEENIALMTPTEKEQYDIAKLQGERLKKAYQGELPLNPATQEALFNREEALKEDLSRKLGTNWRLSTSGIQNYNKFLTDKAMIEDAERRGEIDSGTSRLLQSMGAQQDFANSYIGKYGSYLNRTAPLLQGYGQLGQQYGRQNDIMNQIAMVNAQRKSSERAGLMGGIGSLAGAGIQGGLMFAGLAA